MMKQKWVCPQAVVQAFVSNEYVAACGDSGTVYKFECNAGNQYSKYHVYLNGNDDKPGTNDDIDWSARSGWLKPYHPCGTTHEAASNSGFYSGYMYELYVNYWGEYENTGKRIPVIVWTDNGKNTHCTTNLNKEDWETTKS